MNKEPFAGNEKSGTVLKKKSHFWDVGSPSGTLSKTFSPIISCF